MAIPAKGESLTMDTAYETGTDPGNENGLRAGRKLVLVVSLTSVDTVKVFVSNKESPGAVGGPDWGLIATVTSLDGSVIEVPSAKYVGWTRSGATTPVVRAN